MSVEGWTCSVQDLVKATGGQLVSQVATDFSGVGTDTRQNLEGTLFIALKGDQFDAHDFVQQAVEKKAKAVIVHNWREEWKPLLKQATFVRVPNTLHALQAFAKFWRRKNEFKVIGITGSNGKTSTKEFTHAILKTAFPTYASVGSFNNHWGVPLSILAAGPKTKVLVLEMGMNKSGEIFKLSQIAEPDIVVVTTVGRGHIGELGNQMNIAQAKEEIYLASPKAIHIFNMDNEWTMRMQSRSKAKQIKFSAFRSDVEVHFRAQRMNWDGLDIVGHIGGKSGHTWVHVLGRQNNCNLMAASAVAFAAGVAPEKIWEQLSNLQDSSWGRNQMVPLEGGARLLFDAYNSNPDSVTALLKNLFEMDVEGKKYFVMGDMKELGAFTDSSHEEIGERAAAIGFEKIWYVGQHSAAFLKGLAKGGWTKAMITTSEVDANVAKDFVKGLQAGDLVAVKGSRGVHLEKAVENWPLSAPLGKKP